MTNPIGLIRAAQARDGTSDGDKWGAVIEIVVVVFIISLIPSLLGMDPRSICWYDFWKPVLSALLAAGYAYIRARGLVIEDQVKQDES